MAFSMRDSQDLFQIEAQEKVAKQTGNTNRSLDQIILIQNLQKLNKILPLYFLVLWAQQNPIEKNTVTFNNDKKKPHQN